MRATDNELVIRASFRKPEWAAPKEGLLRISATDYSVRLGAEVDGELILETWLDHDQADELVMALSPEE